MKCLKSTKTNEIIRVSDEKAYNASSEWKFIPKSDWKSLLRKQLKLEEPKVAVVAQEETISEKQLKRKKSK